MTSPISILSSVTAQAAFSSICPDVSFASRVSGEYCSMPWHYVDHKCCGICPSPAINGYGTIIGFCLASFFNMLIVLCQPASSAIFIAAQLTVAHMFLVAIMARNMMGTASNGANGIQAWHAEFAFLAASSIIGVVLACVLSDAHYIHGFSTHEDLERFLNAQDDLKDARRRAEPGTTVCGTHRLQMQEHEAFVRGEHKANVVRGVHRLRKWHSRNQARILLFAFGGSEAYWFILYAVTIWFGKDTIFWQPKCDDFIGAASWSLIRGVSFTIFSLAFLFTLFLCIPVFHPTSTYRSAAHFIVLLFSHHIARPRSNSPSFRDRRRELRNNPTHAPPAEAPAPPIDAPETRPEIIVRFVLSLSIWSLWFVLLLVVFFQARRDFLLTGTGTAPWPYACIQNLMFGTFPIFKFCLNVVRRSAKDRKKRRRANGIATPTSTGLSQTMRRRPFGLDRRPATNEQSLSRSRSRGRRQNRTKDW
ncbi:Proteophosphoglycan 5 [Rhodotorula toruloides ATCC 204091]|uniref:Proteophosphoglycan 5 n=1 Tax=Rhodotorula toruloides TaxID=5286 RepID=A0A0K3CCC3_RHOTO|nr:Proteophosphoglycan 5 [Rhodotorula toruloides ATCC 204091]KAK4330833.1 Proteophosphoglycan 5 [Rhodotorula toruloides]PRQ75664.1 Proteophosphoglycan 5 [Rhodotorula toruloides]